MQRKSQKREVRSEKRCHVPHSQERVRRNLLKQVIIYSFLIVTISGCGFALKQAIPPSPPEGMVYIPEGWFLMGSKEEDGRMGMAVGVDEVPQHRVLLKGFYIDRHEVNVGEYRRFMVSTDRYVPRIWSIEAWQHMYPAPKDNHPMSGVTWYDADEYCRSVGKRLPTEAEWEKAARGTDGRQFPWGNDPVTRQNIKANTLEAWVNWTMPQGSYPEGVSLYGVLDMAGNVMEWTSSWYQAYPGSSLEREAFGEKYKVMKGGGWENPAVPFAMSAHRHAVAPIWDHPGHGFRCAADPQ